jgi:hypothetical protein
MARFKILIISIIVIIGCDESIEIAEDLNLDPNKKLLVRDWRYDYILMDGDTIRDTGVNGEPWAVEGRDSQIELQFLRYLPNHSYELLYGLPEITDRVLGSGVNYQPNFGFWDMERDANSLTLVHNKTIEYEKKYEILELSEDIMRRKLVGDRVTYLVIEQFLGSIQAVDTIVVVSWIEVFVPRDQ